LYLKCSVSANWFFEPQLIFDSLCASMSLSAGWRGRFVADLYI
jgi:hypothetical protein